MAIITFYSNETKETGQTLSIAAIATYMAIEHNYKILIVSTNFNDLSLESCFWEQDKLKTTSAIQPEGNTANVGMESGVEGLIRVMSSGRTSSEIVKGYSRIIFRDRLDILFSPTSKSYKEYVDITPQYKKILSVANTYYDLIFVDLSKKVPKQDTTDILQTSNIIMLGLRQNMQSFNNFNTLKETNDFYKAKNMMLTIGRYDTASKYNNKNITRYLKEKRKISVVPYSTLFFEACSEGKITEFITNMRSITDPNDKDANFIKELKSVDENIITKLQELQMRM